MEVGRPSETSVMIDETTWHHNLKTVIFKETTISIGPTSRNYEGRKLRCCRGAPTAWGNGRLSFHPSAWRHSSGVCFLREATWPPVGERTWCSRIPVWCCFLAGLSQNCSSDQSWRVRGSRHQSELAYDSTRWSVSHDSYLAFFCPVSLNDSSYSSDYMTSDGRMVCE